MIDSNSIKFYVYEMIASVIHLSLWIGVMNGPLTQVLIL